ncbi:MAG: DUF1566 domain-containing protein [Magnetococcales bacterium]|nr:DUF1566 domain-containing protein [Magnetococcales bacterium]
MKHFFPWHGVMAKKESGYSFVALAMVLVVAGVWSSTLILLLPYMETQARQKSAEILKRNKNDILGYVMTNKALPTSLTYTTDGQGNAIQYAYDSRLTTANAICAYQSTYLTVDSLSNIGLAIWSLGPDGVVNPTPTPTKSAGAKSAAVAFVNSVYDKTNSLDDILDWLTLDELKKAAGCEELESVSTLRIVTDGLPAGQAGSVYNDGNPVTFTAQGGSGSSYQWCVESTALSGVLADNMSFPAGTVVGSCTTPYPTSSSTLALTPTSTPFDSSDQSSSGHQIRMFLQDGASNAVNRLFKLVVKLITSISIAKDFSSQFLASATPYAVGDDIYIAKNRDIGVSWSQTTRFTNNGNGTITDTLTGLTWMRNANCWGTRTWANALSRITGLNAGTQSCSGYTTGTYADWRLPNREELHSLVDFGRFNPAFPSGHPFTGLAAGRYWSSTTNANDTADAWSVDFYYGGHIAYGKTIAQNVWPVRGGLDSAPSAVRKTGQTTQYAAGDDGQLEKGVVWPAPRFSNNGNGTVTDNLTTLIWMRNANCWGSQSWSNALSRITGLNAGTQSCSGYASGTYTDWRLPNYRELFSLIDWSLTNPALPSGYPFLNVQTCGISCSYWSGTTYAAVTSSAWVAFFGPGGLAGLTGSPGKTNTRPVWPVRGGQ